MRINTIEASACVPTNEAENIQETSYCSYARPEQTGPIQWLCPKQAQLTNRTEAVRFGK